MTFSILARDSGTGALGGAAATGSLFVGGWVLRGDSRAGMSASQGASPSTLWGEDVLPLMAGGMDAAGAVARVTASDSGREWRQLAVLDRTGSCAVFTGAKNTAWHGSLSGDGVIVSGNLLTGPEVLASMLSGYQRATGSFAERLIAALSSAEAAGGDSRGLQSAALLIVSDESSPLTLRIDWSENPVPALAALYDQTRTEPYAAWVPTVPTRSDPERGHD